MFGSLVVLLKEVALGAMLGLPIAAVWWGVRSAGFIIDQQRSFGAAQAIFTAYAEPSTILGSAFEIAFTTYFVQAGGVALVVDVVIGSFSVWDVWDGYPSPDPDLWTSLSACFARMLSAIAFIATVPLISILVMELGVFLASRSAPNIASDFLVLPIKLVMSAIFSLFALTHAIESGDLLRLMHSR